MSMEKQARLARLLIQKTDEGKLNWEQTIKDDVFLVSFSRNSARIFEEKRNAAPDIVIELLNEDGLVVDQFSDVDLTAADINSSVMWFSALKDLFEKARRKALGSDKAIDDILAELDDDMPY